MIQTLFFESLKSHFFESLKSHFFESLKTNFLESFKIFFFEKMDPFFRFLLWSFLEIVYTIWPNTVPYLSKNSFVFWNNGSIFSYRNLSIQPIFLRWNENLFFENSIYFFRETIYFSQILFISNFDIFMHENQIL